MSRDPPSEEKELAEQWALFAGAEREHAGVDEEAPEQPKKKPYYKELDIRYNVDKFFYCTSPSAQATSYYRYGVLKDCNATMRELWFCLRYKLADEEKQARVVAESRAAEPPKPTSAPVWRLKPRRGDGI